MEGIEATEKQKDYIKGLCERTGVDLPKGLDKFSKAQASRVIDKLLAEQNGNGGEAPSRVNHVRLGLAAKLVSQAWSSTKKRPSTKKGAEEWLSDVEHMYGLLGKAESRVAA